MTVAVVLATGCSSSADDDLSDSDQLGSVENAAPPSSDFCDQANDFVTTSDVRLINVPDATLFEQIDADLASMLRSAPDAVSSDVDALRDGFGAIGAAYAATGFDPASTLTLAPGVQQSNSAAVRSLEDYLIESCSLGDVRAAQIEQIVEAFGLEDPEMAECLHSQLGNVANIDPSSLTPELMTTEVCGTSILGLLSGESINSG